MSGGESLLTPATGGDLSWPIRRAAALHGAREAVVDRGRRLTYAELERRVYALAGALVDLGVSEGGRVGYLGLNSLAHLEAWFAVPICGRVIVDLNVRLAEPELEFMINDCGVELLIVDAEMLERARRLRDRCESLGRLVVTATPREPIEEGGDTDQADATDEADAIYSYERLVEASRAFSYRPLHPDALAAISYTGGTTGLPKG